MWLNDFRRRFNLEVLLFDLLSLGWVIGFLLFWRKKFLSHSAQVSTEELHLSIIVPARNEENNIQKLLKSLSAEMKNFPKLEVLVVDDHSDDQTAKKAQECGARVISNPPLEKGWTGKTWALYNGSTHAKGEIFLFVDADCQFERGGLGKLVSGFLSGKQPLALSVLPFHGIKKPYEVFSLFFNLLMAMGSDAFYLGKQKKQRLMGQSLMIRRQEYEAVGGHESVRGEILENFHLSKILDTSGVHCETYLGKGVLSFRMFPEGMREVFYGWKKSVLRASGGVSPSTLFQSIVWITALMTIIVLIFLGWQWAWTLYAMAVLQVLIFQKRIGSYPLWSALLWPFTLLFYQFVFFAAKLDQRRGLKQRWRGREI